MVDLFIGRVCHEIGHHEWLNPFLFHRCCGHGVTSSKWISYSTLEMHVVVTPTHYMLERIVFVILESSFEYMLTGEQLTPPLPS